MGYEFFQIPVSEQSGLKDELNRLLRGGRIAGKSFGKRMAASSVNGWVKAWQNMPLVTTSFIPDKITSASDKLDQLILCRLWDERIPKQLPQPQTFICHA